MTSNEAILKLQLLLDKTGSPYFTTDEYLSFLNMSQNEVLSRMVPDTIGGGINFDLDSNISQNLAGLIVSNFSMGMNVQGILSETDINNTLISITGDAGAKLLKIVSIGITQNGVTLPVKHKRYNNLWVNNSFKAASSTNPTWVYVTSSVGNGIKFSPINTSAQLLLSAIKSPRLMTAGNSPDFSDYVMNQVIQVAYQMATVATRDEVGLQLGTNTTIQAK